MAISYSDTASEDGFNARAPMDVQVGSARPKFLDGLMFGFMFRFIIGIFAVLIPGVLLFLAKLVFGDALQLTGFAFAFLCVFIVATIFFGEHLRSRVYERVIAGPRARRDESNFMVEVSRGFTKDKHPRVIQLIAKRLFDVVVAFVLLAFFSPLLLAITLAIKLDSSGPVLFRQSRRDFHRREFQLFKFRTALPLMEGSYVDIRSQSSLDPRLTRVGYFLRRTSMSELPQLFNVFAGDLSLVGPRPRFVGQKGDDLNQYIDRVALQYGFRPGLTGLAQLLYYSDDEIAKRMIYEVELTYMRHWSMWLDIKILARTIVTAFWLG
jgi:lipopolysaccharide/colanic/teichoic acid biosynthesis glycosyltransferase